MKPFLKNKRTDSIKRAVTRRLAEGDLAALIRAEDSALEQIDPSTVTRFSREEFLSILQRGEILGIFAEETLVGACGIVIPHQNDDNLAARAGLTDAEIPLAATIPFVFVLPDYRGNGISRELMLGCFQLAVDRLGAAHIVFSASPRSVACILAAMSINNMRLRAMTQLDGHVRFIFCYSRNDKRLFTIYERYPLDDTYAITKALANHYEGIATHQKEGITYIWMAK